MSSEKRWMSAALEDDFVRSFGGDESQGFRNVVVLLNDCSAQSPVVEMFRCPEDCLLEIWVFKELHASGVPWPASRGRVVVRRADRSRIVKRDSANCAGDAAPGGFSRPVGP